MSMSMILKMEIEYTYSDDRLPLLDSLRLSLLDQIRHVCCPRAYLRRGEMTSNFLECRKKVVQPYRIVESGTLPSQHEVYVVIGAAIGKRHGVFRNGSYLPEVV